MEGQQHYDQNQQLRRKYPTNKEGAKSEWFGMEHHLAEIGQDLAKNEKDIIMLRKKELLTELDRKVLEQLQRKQEELQLKQFEAQEMLRRKDIYDQEHRKYMEDRQALKNAISGVYDKQKQESMLREMEQREQRLEWERLALEENRTRMESEQRKRRLQKDVWAQEQHQDLQLAHQRHQDQYQRRQQDQVEQQELLKRNAERELVKEENYRNFYRMCADNQANLQRMHIDNVMQPLLDRQRQLEDMIARNVDQYQRKLLQDELDRVLKRQQDYHQTLSLNKQIMAEHQQYKDYERFEKDERNKQRLEDLNNYNNYLSYKKQETLDKQRQYKEFLDQQKKEKEEFKHQAHRMGRAEKAMNIHDLHSYKNEDHTIHTMIPGYSPQVGQLPPKQHNMLVQKNNSMTTLKQHENDVVNQNLSTINNQVEEFRNTRGNTLRGVAQSTIMQSTVSPAQNQMSHNPLTNPMPYNNQNPYIRREQQNLQNFRARPY